MTPSQKRALAQLLQDTDATTVDLVKRELLRGGPERLAAYREWVAELGDIPGRHLRDIIGKLEDSQHLHSVSWTLAELRDLTGVEALCWELARADDRQFDAAPYQALLDDWAAVVHDRLATARPQGGAAQAKILADFLHGEQKLTGSPDNYYHPDNALLHRTLDRRRGMPLTVSLVYLLVGARIGLPVEGISAPGHFVVRLDGVVFDPYYDGRIIPVAEWDALVAEVPPGQLDLVENACTPLHLAHRMLINLRNAYVREHDFPREQRLEHYLAVLQR